MVLQICSQRSNVNVNIVRTDAIVVVSNYECCNIFSNFYTIQNVNLKKNLINLNKNNNKN